MAVGTHKGRAALSGALLDRAWRQGALNSAEGRGRGRKPAGGQQGAEFSEPADGTRRCRLTSGDSQGRGPGDSTGSWVAKGALSFSTPLAAVALVLEQEFSKVKFFRVLEFERIRVGIC